MDNHFSPTYHLGMYLYSELPSEIIKKVKREKNNRFGRKIIESSFFRIYNY